jgi:hypothetical protein
VGTGVDIDDVGTWPPHIRVFSEKWASALQGTTRFAADLKLPAAEQALFEAMISSLPLRAFHCTRLLDEEAAAIRRQGLVPLSEAFVASRIRNACAAGHLTAAEHDTLMSASVFAAGNLTGRPGQVCAVVGRTIFDEDPGAVGTLLGLWGGEAIYWAHEGTALAARLRAMGKPSVVVVNLRPAVSSRAPFFAPPPAKLFVGHLLRLTGTYGDVHCYGPVMPEDIIDIWQPGHRDYDRHDLRIAERRTR